MAKKDFDGIISIYELAALRHFTGDKCCTSQGIAVQLKQGQDGLKTWKELGFEYVPAPGKTTFLRLTDPKMEDFRLKLLAFAKDNAPK